MENYIVSARKYRPETFKSVVGQDSITVTLKNSIKNKHIAHAYLFCGPRGIGKTTCARIFAKAINCMSSNDDNEACNNCESCNAFNKSSSYNIHELDAASNNSVEDIRNLIDLVRVPPQIGIYSVYIIDEVHMLSSQAFNAFLKTLEEPPPYAIFILATTEKHKIIPTILSRCQIYDFHRIEIDDISNHLQWVAESEGVNIDAEALNIIAQKADGAMRDALSMFDQLVSFSGNTITYKDAIENLNVLDYDYYFKLTGSFLNGDYHNALMIFDNILDKGFDVLYFISGLSEHIRDLLVCKDAVTLKLLEVGTAFVERYKEQSVRFSDAFLYKALGILNNCEINYKMSRNKRLHVELSILMLCNINNNITNNDNKVSDSKSEYNTKPVITKPKETIEEKEPITKVETPTVTEKMTRIPSIKKDLKGIKKEEAIITTNNIEDNNQEIINKEFNQDDLTIKWNAFAETIKEDPRIYSTLISHPPILKENFQIEFNLNNSLQEESISKIKGDIVRYLRDNLSNSNIDLTTTVIEIQNDSKQIYTNKDKFNHLNEVNPNLNKLRQQFNLDFDI